MIINISENEISEFTGQMIDIFEDFLDEKKIKLENSEKEQSDGAANIYGTDYGILQTDIENILYNWSNKEEFEKDNDKVNPIHFFQITETLDRVIGVKSDTIQEGYDKVSKLYDSGDIQLDADNSNVSKKITIIDQSCYNDLIKNSKGIIE